MNPKLNGQTRPKFAVFAFCGGTILIAGRFAADPKLQPICWPAVFDAASLFVPLIGAALMVALAVISFFMREERQTVVEYSSYFLLFAFGFVLSDRVTDMFTDSDRAKYERGLAQCRYCKSLTPEVIEHLRVSTPSLMKNSICNDKQGSHIVGRAVIIKDNAPFWPKTTSAFVRRKLVADELHDASSAIWLNSSAPCHIVVVHLPTRQITATKKFSAAELKGLRLGGLGRRSPGLLSALLGMWTEAQAWEKAVEAWVLEPKSAR
ncbi:MAG: hypothetical protein IT168_04125 [Bryobacterales bacterium]|nr:hypothetical protein [Bryobacterales bacterium]